MIIIGTIATTADGARAGTGHGPCIMDTGVTGTQIMAIVAMQTAIHTVTVGSVHESPIPATSSHEDPLGGNRIMPGVTRPAAAGHNR